MLQVTTEGNITIAILNFTNITSDDGSEYSCITIFQDFSSNVNTIRVIVDPGTSLLYYIHTPLPQWGTILVLTNYRQLLL